MTAPTGDSEINTEVRGEGSENPEFPNTRSTSGCRDELRRCFPDLQVASIVSIPELGADSDVVVVNEEWVFRLPRNPKVVALITKEIALLPELAPTLPVAVPRFEFVCEESAIVGYRMIRGEPLSADLIAEAGDYVVGTELGRFLTSLHSFPVATAQRLGVPDAPAEPARCLETCERFRSVVGPMISTAERRAAEAIMNEVFDDPDAFSFEPVLVHTELNSEHLLFSDRARLAGVIDWSDCAIGDPVLDITWLVNEERGSLGSALLSAYERPRDPAFERRARLYFQIIGPFWQIEFGVESGQSDYISNGVATLRERLEAL